MGFIQKNYTIEKPIKLFLFLMREFNLNMKQAQRYVAKSHVFQDSIALKDAGMVVKGEVSVSFFEPDAAIGLKPVFESKRFAFFDKPSGMMVHPKGRRVESTLLDEIKTYFHKESNLVHRIDKETSGLVMVSKYSEDEAQIKSIFESRDIKKVYHTVLEGELKTKTIVNKPIKKRTDFSKSKHRVEISEEGKVALTEFIPIFYDKDRNITFVHAYPHTGRTHQIRIHAYEIGHRIVGEPLYGTTFEQANNYLDELMDREDRIKSTGASRLLLHAFSLEFRYNSKYYIESKILLEKSYKEYMEI